MDNVFETKDKKTAPFLFIQPDIDYEGIRIVGQIIYFRFSPYSKCLKLVQDFISRKAKPVQAKDLLEAVDSCRDIIFEIKEKEKWETFKK